MGRKRSGIKVEEEEEAMIEVELQQIGQWREFLSFNFSVGRRFKIGGCFGT